MKTVSLLLSIVILCLSCETEVYKTSHNVEEQEWYKKAKESCSSDGACKLSIHEAEYQDMTVFYTSIGGSLCCPIPYVLLRKENGDSIREYKMGDMDTFDKEVTYKEMIYSCVPYTYILKDVLYGDGEEGIEKSNLIIRNKKEWTELLRKMDSVNEVSDAITQTNIDFENFDVIAVFDQVRSSGGYAIEISSIVEERKQITVAAESIKPKQNIGTSSVMTQPFHIVMVKKSSKDYLFTHTEKPFPYVD